MKTSFSEGHELYKDQNFKYAWGDQDLKKIERGTGKGVADKVKVPSDLPLILDIDLDAFCCHQTDTLSFLPVKREKYQGVFGYEGRIDRTLEVLAQLPRPDLITVASSQGDLQETCYVPSFMVEEVSRYLAFNLRKIYE